MRVGTDSMPTRSNASFRVASPFAGTGSPLMLEARARA
jgi:hypothetical protein